MPRLFFALALIILACDAQAQAPTGQWFVEQSSIQYADPANARYEQQPSFWEFMASNAAAVKINAEGYSEKFIARVHGQEVSCRLKMDDQTLWVIFHDHSDKSSSTEYSYTFDAGKKTLHLRSETPYRTETVTLKK